VPPGEHLLGEGRRDQTLPAQQGEPFLPEPWLKHLARNGRQHVETALGIESAIRREHVNMRVEVNEIAEGLDEKNHPRPCAGPRACIGTPEQPFDYVAQLPQQCAPAREQRPQQARNRWTTLVSTPRPNLPSAFSSDACRTAH